MESRGSGGKEKKQKKEGLKSRQKRDKNSCCEFSITGRQW